MFGKLRIGIMGTGRMAEQMAGHIRKTKGVECVAVASRSKERAEAFAAKFNLKRVYDSYEDLARDPKVQLIYIATPHTEHFENAKLAIAHKKNVLVEKPFTVNKAQAEELFRLAEEKEVLVTEAMWVRYMPFLADIKHAVAGRSIGQTTMLNADLGYNVRSKRRMTDPLLGGGALMDVGVYALTFASMMFGNDILEINPTCTYTNAGIDEQDTITIKYRDGRVASLQASMIGITPRQGTIIGTRGYITVQNINNFESYAIYNADHEMIASGKRPKQKADGYEYELQACREAIKAHMQECPAMPHSATLEIMEQLDTIRGKLGITYPGDPDYALPEMHAAADWTPEEETVVKEPVAEEPAPEETVEAATAETNAEETAEDTVETPVELAETAADSPVQTVPDAATATADATTVDIASTDVTPTEPEKKKHRLFFGRKHKSSDEEQTDKGNEEN